MALDRGVLVVSGFVFFNMLVTLSIWCYVYEMKHMVYSHFPMLDIDGLSTTGSNLLDGILNGLFIATIIAVMSIIMGQCILRRLKSCVVLFVKSTFMMMSYIMPATIIFDTLLKFLGPENPYIYLFTIIASLLFTSTIIAAYFTDHLPTFIRQTLTILNCSCVSIYYLRFLPRYTIWFLMAAIILWDLFSVNSSFGPLKVAALNAHDYSERILPFMFFIAKNNKNKEEEEEESSDENSDTFSDNNTTINDEEEEGESCSDECLTEFTLNSTFSYDEIEDSIDEENNVKNEERTAFDALNVSGQTVIGMGDFVIYGLLVGKAAADMDGCFNFAVLFTIIGVLFGLFYTLTLSEESDNDDVTRLFTSHFQFHLLLVLLCYFLTYFVIGKFNGEN
uniref:Presenilin n=1 Tax=Meloidogyne incognita TaxID=6306 RepID=A0A914NSE8_MELIC